MIGVMSAVEDEHRRLSHLFTGAPVDVSAVTVPVERGEITTLPRRRFRKMPPSSYTALRTHTHKYCTSSSVHGV